MQSNTRCPSHSFRGTAAVLALAITAGLLPALSAAAEVTTQPDTETLLYVKTTPPGAELRLEQQETISQTAWVEKKRALAGELLTVDPGTYRLTVSLAGYEPHVQELTIAAGRVTRLELALSRANGAAAALAAGNTLKYDDDSPDGKRSIAMNGEMVRFALPPGKWKVKGIQLHGARYGYPQPPAEDFTVYFLDKNYEEVASEDIPYRKFQRGPEKWVALRFKEPVEVPEEFWVCVNFNAERTKGVFVSFDTSTGGKHSKTGLPGEEVKDIDFGGDWMIRVNLVPADEAQTGSRRTTTLKHDDGTPDGQRSMGGEAEMVRFSLPEGNWKVKGIQLYGSRYGYPQPPAENFRIDLLSGDLSTIVATQHAPYRLFNRGNARWVRIRFRKPVEVPREFWVAVNFNAERTKGVFVNFDTSTGGQFSKVGVPDGEKRDAGVGGDWMIRVDLAPAGP